MLVAFELNVTSKGSWNNKWSGECNRYIRVRTVSSEKADKVVAKSPYWYRWDDGWSISITVSKITKQQANSLLRKSSGFYGYDWMINSIIDCGEIRTPER